MKKKPMKESVKRASTELALHLSAPPPMNDTTPVKRKLTVLPSFSKTDQFLGCPWPWGREIEVAQGNVSRYALYGSAAHEALEQLLLKKKPRYADIAERWQSGSVSELQVRAEAAHRSLMTWLNGVNPWGINFHKKSLGWKLETEASAAIDLLGEASPLVRRCAPPDVETHEYRDRRPGELPGTMDLIGAGLCPAPVGARRIGLYLDHKFGFDVGSPLESGQLLSGAIAIVNLYEVDEVIIAFLHAPHNQEPTVYADSVTADQLEAHVAALREAFERPMPHPSLTPTEANCRYCAAKSICPTKAGALAELRGGGKLVTPEDVGRAHSQLKAAERRFAELHGIIDSEIRQWVRLNGDAVNERGESIGFVERNYTNLSQQSIIRALGELKGRREIQRLMKMGCIETGVRKELRVK